MPTLTDLRNRFNSRSANSTLLANVHEAESLIFDGRSHLTPKQLVESKLRRALTQMEQRAALANTNAVGR